MARNKHPEETVEKILTVSKRLFAARGYAHTTLADIMAATGMSKGAFYHHFKSKEDVYDRICNQYYDQQEWMRNGTKFPGKNALEKMRGLFFFLLSDPTKLNLDQISASIVLNPRLLLLVILSTLRDAAPLVAELIQEGNQDGSIQVAQPKEMAESFMLLINVWLGNFHGTRMDFEGKLSFLQSFTNAMGLPLFDVKLIDAALRYYDCIIALPTSPSSQAQG